MASGFESVGQILGILAGASVAIIRGYRQQVRKSAVGPSEIVHEVQPQQIHDQRVTGCEEEGEDMQAVLAALEQLQRRIDDLDRAVRVVTQRQRDMHQENVRRSDEFKSHQEEKNKMISEIQSEQFQNSVRLEEMRRGIQEMRSVLQRNRQFYEAMVAKFGNPESNDPSGR
jgi:type I site-specific restriction endonuclease